MTTIDLDVFRLIHGPFYLVRLEKHGDKVVSVWHEWLSFDSLAKCNSPLLERANQRSITDDEVVIDLDSETIGENLDRAAAIIKDLREQGIKFKAWKTGSKGVHIHIYFSDLSSMMEEPRKAFKQAVIKKYGGDERKADTRSMIALENAPHFKTGRPKTLIQDDDQLDKGNEQLPDIRFSVEKHGQTRYAGAKWNGSTYSLPVGKHIRCPFHPFKKGREDKIPSCFITKKGFFCYGCHARGSLLTLRRQLAAREVKT